jgi:metallo-beta-lactamase family protein
VDGAKRVRIFGRDYEVRAKISQIYGFSGHADHDGLMRWITHFHDGDGGSSGSIAQPPKRVFMTHGEEPVALKLAAEIKATLGMETYVPHYRETVQL